MCNIINSGNNIMCSTIIIIILVVVVVVVVAVINVIIISSRCLNHVSDAKFEIDHFENILDTHTCIYYA